MYLQSRASYSAIPSWTTSPSWATQWTTSGAGSAAEGRATAAWTTWTPKKTWTSRRNFWGPRHPAIRKGLTILWGDSSRPFKGPTANPQEPCCGHSSNLAAPVCRILGCLSIQGQFVSSLLYRRYDCFREAEVKPRGLSYSVPDPEKWKTCEILVGSR
jgi:hypothetical protein